MYTEEQRIDFLRKINFGDIDGYGDPDLEKYFLDNDYWGKIITDKFFLITGRKGTGKSAIYRMIEEQSHSHGVIVHNMNFGDFPFSRLLALDDDNFAKPSQYQSIWKYMILVDFCCLITNSPFDEDADNRYFNDIKKFVDTCVGNSISDMYKEVVTKTRKKEGSLVSDYFALTSEATNESKYNLAHLRDVSVFNQRVQDILIDYLKTCSENRKVVIQLDRLDDNYNALQQVDDYYCVIASLLKFAYSFNLELRRNHITNAKVVIYLRNDLLSGIGKIDAESSRWNEYRYDIDWTINNLYNYPTSKLYQMINKRISASLGNSSIVFDDVFDTQSINLLGKNQEPYSVFRYILERTMYRPRDVVQFCKIIQKEAVKNGKLFFRIIKNAEKEYCAWLVYKELTNEINPVINDTDGLYEVLRELGQRSFALTDFYVKTKGFCEKSAISSEQLAKLLYEVGILYNINTTKDGYTHRRSALRNHGSLNKSMRLIIHPGVWQGISC